MKFGILGRGSDGRVKLPVTLAVLVGLGTLAMRVGFSDKPRVQEVSGTSAYGPLPVQFIANRGQVSPEVRYMAKAAGVEAYFTPAETVLNLRGGTVRLRFLGANSSPRVEGIDPLPGRVNFLISDRRDRWRIDVPTYAGIVYREVYPGVDVFFRGAAGRLKSEFVVAPGADPASIRCTYVGVDRLSVSETGALVLATAAGELRQEPPDIYQELEGTRVSVDGGFRLFDGGAVGFDVGAYDPTRPLVIDPVLSYSTYLGGSGLDSAKAIAVDANGNAYITGQTDSFDFPTANALRNQSAGGVDVFVAKLNPAGNTLIYCTYLGGSWDDRGFGIAVDGSGSAYVTGWTSSPNFPTTTSARQRGLAGGRDAFVAKLTSAGNGLVFSTYLGGNSHDSGTAIALDSMGNAVVAGDTYSTNFPVINAFQGPNGGRQDAFVAKLKADGSALVWSTYLGGTGEESGKGLALDGSGNAYITGSTDSTNFPTLNAVQGSPGGGQDAFVTKLGTDGRTLIYSSYLGGSGGTVGAAEMGVGIKVDSAGNAYVAGITSSTNFPVASALQPGFAGGTTDAFVAKLNPAGTGLLYSTYLGGVSLDYASGIVVDASGIAAVTGYTASTDFPTVNAVQTGNAGGYDAFIAKLNPQGSSLVESTYLGGSDSDVGNAVALDAAGRTYVAGQTLSLNFPLKNPVQTVNKGGVTAFVARIEEYAPAAVFRSTGGATMLTSYGSTTLSNAGGVIASDPGISQNSAGDAFVVGRNSANYVWMNIYQANSRTWKGWVLVGGPLFGNPAVAAMSSGEAYVVALDSSSAYRINKYEPGQGFQGWITLEGTFASDPAVAAAANGSIYIVGRANSGVVWSGRFLPSVGFQGWVSGGAGAPTGLGRPAVAVGSDGAAYVAVRAADKAVWMARVQGDAWGSWFSGGGTLGSDPELAAGAGTINAVVTSPTGGVYVQPFREGTGNGWQGWIFTGGALERASVAAVGTRFFIAGRSLSNALWWCQSGGAGWTYLGYTGWSASNLAAAPK